MKKAVFLSFIVLAGCGTPKMWVRTDGQAIPGNAKLEQDKVVDMTICQGEAQKAHLSGTALNLGQANARADMATEVLEGCMAQKGYLHVPVPQQAQ